MSDDEEWLEKYKNVKRQPLKWTPKNEEQLEALLIQNNFDFVKTAREFTKIVNEDEQEFFFEVDAKQL